MRTIRFTAIFLFKFLQRYTKTIAVLGLLIVLLLAVFIKMHDRLFKQTITEGIVGTYTEDNLPPVVTNLISQGLVELDPSGEPKPNLVSGWQVNSTATEYTFKLKKGLKWLDGTELKASDINLALSDTEVKVSDDQTLVFKLDDSFSPFPTLLNKPITKKGSSVGTGPYRISRIDKNEVFITSVKLTSSDPNLPNLSIRFYPNEKTADQALKSGEIESFLEANQLDYFVNNGPFTIINKPNHTRLVTIFYNTADQVLADKNFRLALSFAAPSIKGEEEAKTSLPSTSWAFNSQVKDYLDNNEEAKLSLDKVKSGKDSTIVLTATMPLQKIGQQVVEAWRKQGIKAELKVESGIPQNFQALLIDQEIPFDPDQYSLWHSTQTQTNISKYSSPRIDKDLEDGRKLVNQEDRKAKYQDFQKVLLDDSPATFLYFPKYNIISLKKIQQPLQKVLKLQLSDISI